MRLLIISSMPHHLWADGTVVGWAPTVREIDQLATRFTEVRHIACLHPGTAPKSDIPYSTPNIQIIPVPPSGAEGFLGKLDVLRTSPHYVRAILQELSHADMVHVRGPAHIALIAILMLPMFRRPHARWIKYAGNWKPAGAESLSYTLQRWWLARGWHRGIVTVNGAWQGQAEHVRTFFNPSLDENDIARGRASAERKQHHHPLQLLYVGRVELPKGALRAIEIVDRLIKRRVPVRLQLIGDGADRERFMRLVRERGLDNVIEFLGWKPPTEIQAAYERAHVLLLPTSASEGWPKVLSEGMAFGVVPLAGAVSSIPQYLAQIGVGKALRPDDLDGFVAAIEEYVTQPETWLAESRRSAEATQWFSFEHYLRSVDRLLADLGVTSTRR